MSGDGRRRPLPAAPLALLVLLAVAVLLGLLALGHWQLERRVWKLALIERVQRQLAAAPVPAPAPADWPGLSAQDEYRRVEVEGEFLHARETCTQAVTVRGPGCWVMTPLRTPAGWMLLINRGFVDAEHRDPATRPEGQITGTVQLSGLLRLSEPGGGFLRHNRPAENRWYSRDVAAIAEARALQDAPVAPYFIDAETSVAGGPVGGLTVLKFRNSHLVYALTWFGLAAMVLAALALLLRQEWRLRRRRT
ncbi:SURF1 family protein [Stagnimonas aquatica]|uniref:SURF1-like protein n=1 Tax=Stagnimonas aquatica TaxID=2689987 RepID=A0A3N0VKI8_9GAMM|nr:SURF1 family protein [Stagnimonas aquatica]ROH93279.1 SURF1 family protein [Stagnimonas aquatica]